MNVKSVGFLLPVYISNMLHKQFRNYSTSMKNHYNNTLFYLCMLHLDYIK